MAGQARYFSSIVLAASLVLAGAVVLSGSNAVAAQEPAKRSIRDGVYTDMQADRGEREYGRSCEHCHGASLEGNPAREVPPLVSDPFMRSWSGKNLRQLFELLSRSMPADNRGGLSARTYTDLIAFLLRANDVPAGSSVLPDGLAELEAISIDKP